MTRATLARVWTDAEEDRAARILDAISGTDGGLVAAISVVRALDLPYDHAHRAASLRKVYDVIPLAVMRSVVMFPGRALHVLRRGGVTLYRITDDPTVVLPVVLARFQRIHTMLTRASAETEPLRALTDLPSVVIVTAADSALAALPPRLLDALSQAVAEARS